MTHRQAERVLDRLQVMTRKRDIGKTPEEGHAARERERERQRLSIEDTLDVCLVHHSIFVCLSMSSSVTFINSTQSSPTIFRIIFSPNMIMCTQSDIHTPPASLSLLSSDPIPRANVIIVIINLPFDDLEHCHQLRWIWAQHM